MIAVIVLSTVAAGVFLQLLDRRLQRVVRSQSNMSDVITVLEYVGLCAVVLVFVAITLKV